MSVSFTTCRLPVAGRVGWCDESDARSRIPQCALPTWRWWTMRMRLWQNFLTFFSFFSIVSKAKSLPFAKALFLRLNPIKTQWEKWNVRRERWKREMKGIFLVENKGEDYANRIVSVNSLLVVSQRSNYAFMRFFFFVSRTICSAL